MFNLSRFCVAYLFVFALFCNVLQKVSANDGEIDSCQEAHSYRRRIDEIMGTWYLQEQETYSDKKHQCVEINVVKEGKKFILQESFRTIATTGKLEPWNTTKHQIFEGHKANDMVDLTESFEGGSTIFKVLETENGVFATVCSYVLNEPGKESYYLFTREREVNQTVITPIIRKTKLSFEGFRDLMSVDQSEDICDGARTMAPAIVMIVVAVFSLICLYY